MTTIYCPKEMVAELVHAAGQINDLSTICQKDDCQVTVVDWQACADAVFHAIEEKLAACEKPSLLWHTFVTDYVWAPLYSFLIAAYKDGVVISKGHWNQVKFVVAQKFSRFWSVGREATTEELLRQLKIERPCYDRE